MSNRAVCEVGARSLPYSGPVGGSDPEVASASSTGWAIDIDHVSKVYAVGEQEQYLALRDVIAAAPGRALRRFRRAPSVALPRHRALDDVTFEVSAGEVVGLIGRNGAGKSTLLKLISSITRPTSGAVRVRGRVGTLLEVGSGFHPELTGRENVYLNGAVLGMRRAEIDASFDDIVEFSGVSTYLDTPVKRYSSGMYMRLAFSVAAHLDTEILLVDEVLAVGDAEFQRKCVSRMRQLSQGEGRTVVFVSHNDTAIKQLCPRAVWLMDGQMRADGPTADVMREYLDAQFRDVPIGRWIDVSDHERIGSGEARFASVRVEAGPSGSRTIAPGGPLTVRCRIEATERVRFGVVAVYLSTLGGLKVVSAGSSPGDTPIELSPGTTTVDITVDSLHLNPGRYSGSLWLARPTGARRRFGLYDHVEEAFDLVVEAGDTDDSEGLVSTRSSVMIIETEARTR